MGDRLGPDGTDLEMSVDTITATDAHQPLQQPLRKLQIDFLFLDLTSCTRCRGTDRSLSEALIVVADVLHAAGIAVEVTKVHVATEELARAWRFVSSPTIRVNGSDIALDLRETRAAPRPAPTVAVTRSPAGSGCTAARSTPSRQRS
jgi:Domain of unknown function (DUF2703)